MHERLGFNRRKGKPPHLSRPLATAKLAKVDEGHQQAYNQQSEELLPLQNELLELLIRSSRHLPMFDEAK